MAIITIVGAGMMGSALAFPARENKNEVRVVGTHLDRDIIDFCIENNKMDLKEFVWKNIVLEIPIRVVKDESTNQTMEGNGWSLNKEEKQESAFSKLNELFENDEK